MVSQQLIDYIKHQQQMGHSKEQITSTLLAQGWHQADVEEGFAHAASGVPMPVSGPVSTELPKIGRLFSDSFELMKKRILVMVVSGLLPILGLVAFSIVAGTVWFIVHKFSSIASNILLLIFAVLGVVAIFYAIFWVATAYFTALRDADENTGIKENLKRARPLIGSFLVVGLLTQLVALGGFVLLIIPGIIFMVWYCFAPMIMVAEGKKGRAALAQSKAYVAGRWWKVFGRIVLLNLIYIVPAMVLQAVLAFNRNWGVNIFLRIVLFIWQFFYAYFQLSYSYTLYKQVKNSAPAADGGKYIGAITGWAIWGGIGGIIVIGGLIASVVLLALNSARSTSRDAQRLADVRQVSSVLELYFNDNNAYPENLSGLTPKYIEQLPTAPEPADGTCTTAENTYTYSLLNTDQYDLAFCLGRNTGGYSSGPHIMTESGMDPASTAPQPAPLTN